MAEYNDSYDSDSDEFYWGSYKSTLMPHDDPKMSDEKSSKTEFDSKLASLYRDCIDQCNVCNILIFTKDGFWYSSLGQGHYRRYCNKCGPLLRPVATCVLPSEISGSK